MNYAELTTNLQDYLLNDEASFVTHIPDIVKQAEEDIYLNTQIPALRKNVTGAATSGNPYLTIPSDFLSAYSVAVISAGVHSYLINKEVDYIRAAYSAAATTGQPKYYGLFDNDTLILGPTPNSNYTIEMHYFYKPNSIVTDSTTWLGTNAPNALLYGSLVHGYVYMKGEQDVLEQYRQEYARALSNLQTITEGRARKDTYRMPNKKVEL